ncbi:WHG domain-containing protein [Streptomyces sp. NBC_01267]|uniref:WHG domain-containing protein n=1 Tax=Streptomyces sp. NBC_01267 TaxID=2903805 RepID=UPI003FCC9D45
MDAPISADGFWRLAPDWVPRTGYAPLTKGLFREVAAGLERQLDRMDEQPEFEVSVLKWPPCRCGRPVCPDAPKADADAAESPTMARLGTRLTAWDICRPPATALLLIAWGHLHGLVALEVFRHTSSLGDHRTESFRTAMRNLLEDIHRRIAVALAPRP